MNACAYPGCACDVDAPGCRWTQPPRRRAMPVALRRRCRTVHPSTGLRCVKGPKHTRSMHQGERLHVDTHGEPYWWRARWVVLWPWPIGAD